MKSKIKTVYYCEYCKKHFLRKDSVRNHEARCTMNPGRYCGLCENNKIFPIIAKYLVRYRWVQDSPISQSRRLEWIDLFGNSDGPVKLDDILQDVEGCPNCTLTVLRICKLCKAGIQFDYKKALEDWWTDINNEERRKDGEALMYS